MPANATSYLDTGLTPGDSYSYQVLASNTVGNTASSTATVTTPVPPLAVSELQPASITTTSAVLSWVLNSINDTGVQVWRQCRRRRQFLARDDLAGRLDQLSRTTACNRARFTNTTCTPSTSPVRLPPPIPD